MRLPSQKRILREDVKGAPGWIVPVIDTFNSFADSVYQALNRNITFTENIADQIKELTYVTPSTYPVMEDYSFVSSLKTKAIGVLLLQALDRDTYEPVSIDTSVPWVEINGSIVIKPLEGLEASKTYTIRLLVI